MDILKELQKRVDTLVPPDSTTGLVRVLSHLQTAQQYIYKGRRGNFEAFTDAVNRINQAFEGTLRETYRALGGARPGSVRLHEIEQFLKQHLPERIITHLATYRTSWRNVAAHQHDAYFKEDEVILAFLLISALSLLLIDEIAAKTGAVRGSQGRPLRPLPVGQPLLDTLAFAMREFKLPPEPRLIELPLLAEITGAIEAYLTPLFPALTFEAGVQLVKERPELVDLLARSSHTRIIFEIKRQYLTPVQLGMTLERLKSYMQAASLTEGILYVFRGKSHAMKIWPADQNVPQQLKILVVHPARP